jgi:predicted nucleotidyltransferase
VLLPFNEQGDLPPGIHQTTLEQVKARFASVSIRRQVLFVRLELIYQIAKATGHLARFIVFGSFVTDKMEPNDVDVFMLMENTFDYSQLAGDASLLFDHNIAQDHFGASIFWIRRLAAFDGEEATVAYWQVKRDGSQRGIVEIVSEAT